ncbi:hypothetical protein ACFLZH_03300 [Patescibacteria group bacterium]
MSKKTKIIVGAALAIVIIAGIAVFATNGDFFQGKSFKPTSSEPYLCGNSEDYDGIYSACKNDSIIHLTTGTTFTIENITNRTKAKYVDISYDGQTVRINLGETKIIQSSKGQNISLFYEHYDNIHGAHISITTPSLINVDFQLPLQMAK